MISVEEATALVFATTHVLPAKLVPLPTALGRVLREPLYADRDFPPFDRVAMDGIALRYEDLTSGLTEFLVERVQLAGQRPEPLQQRGSAVEIMTGAALPPGTDTVVRYEDLQLHADAHGRLLARVQAVPPRSGHNVHRRATDRHQGELLLPAGTYLGPAEIAVAATVGATALSVTRRPRVAVISTGNELVDISLAPQPYQIRRSNSYMLQAAATQAGAVADTFHFDDDMAALVTGLPALLRDYDALLLSGGISRGKADYLPTALREVGVEQLFHEVQQRPGKPFWFGRHPLGTVVFALPGNPVSTLVNYHRYAQPWLTAVQQPAQAPAPPTYAVLAADVEFRPALTYFSLVSLHSAPDGRLLAQPVRNQGSGDLASLLHCDGALEMPAHQMHFRAGQVLPVYRFR